MQLWRQIASGYLVLCLVFAGLVGISPDLHRFVEHGGDGPIHSHRGAWAEQPRPQVSSHDHSHPHSYRPALAENQGRGLEKTRSSGLFVSKHHSFDLPLDRLWHAFNHFLEDLASDSHHSHDTPSSDDKPDHDHHSLAQLLAAGLLEQNVDVPVLAFDFVLCRSSLPKPEAVILGRRFDAQTAGRAPPSRWS